MSGLSSGSSRSACAGSISSQSTPVSRATLGEAVGVGGVVQRGGDEQPADVLDESAAICRRIAVLGDALLGGARVLDRVAAARVQQPVEAAAGSLGEVGAVDEDDVESAQRRVPGHAGAGGASADHEDIGAQCDHRVASLPPVAKAARCGPPPAGYSLASLARLVDPVEGPRDGLLPLLVVRVALGGVHLRLQRLSSAQLSRTSCVLLQNPTARPAA